MWTDVVYFREHQEEGAGFEFAFKSAATSARAHLLPSFGCACLGRCLCGLERICARGAQGQSLGDRDWLWPDETPAGV